MNFLQSIGAAIASVGIFIGSLFGFTYQEAQPTGDELGRAVNPVAGKTYVLAGSGISSSATSITLTSFTIPVSGARYTMSHFGDTVGAKGYLTIEPGNPTRQEFVSFTGITQNADGSATLTGVSRGLAPVFPYTASTTYAMAHSGGAQVVISNAPQLYEAIYSYIDNATTSGAVDAAPTIKGLVEVASGQEAASSTLTGNTTAPLALTTAISTSTGGRAHTIPVTKLDGKIDASFLSDTFGSTTVRVFTASSTWTRPNNVKFVVVEMVGGGANGGDTSATDAQGVGGGGSGAYGKFVLASSTLPSSIFVQIGATATNTTIGNINSTILTGFATATAGTKGAAPSGSGEGSDGGVGGVLTVAGNVANLMRIDGAYGAAGFAGTTIQGMGGSGGSNPLGNGGGGGFTTTTADNGRPGTGYGAGGGGGATSAASAASGGTGTNGVVVITEYF